MLKGNAFHSPAVWRANYLPQLSINRDPVCLSQVLEGNCFLPIEYWGAGEGGAAGEGRGGRGMGGRTEGGEGVARRGGEGGHGEGERRGGRGRGAEGEGAGRGERGAGRGGLSVSYLSMGGQLFWLT